VRGRSLAFVLALGFLWTEGAAAQDAVDRFTVCKSRETKRFVACPEVLVDPPIVVEQPGGLTLLEAKVELLRMLRPDLADALREAAKLEDEAAVDEALEVALYKPRITVAGMGGPITVVGTDAGAAIEPFASFHVRAPLTTWKLSPRLEAIVELTAQHGDALGGGLDPQAFKALEVDLALCQPLPRPMLFSLCGTFGAASRLSTSSDRRDRVPLYASADALFATDDGEHWLKVGIGPDQRLAGSWALTISIAGRLRLPVARNGPVGVYLVGEILRALDVVIPGFSVPRRDSVRAGVAAGF
jgi:hypothetical protein